MGKVIKEYLTNGIIIRDSSKVHENIGVNHTVPGVFLLPNIPIELFSKITSGVIVSTTVKVEHAYKGDVNSFKLMNLPIDSPEFARPEHLKDLKTLAALKAKMMEMDERRRGLREDVSTRGKKRVKRILKLSSGGTFFSVPYRGQASFAHNEVLMHLDAKSIIGIHLCVTSKESIKEAFEIEKNLSNQGVKNLDFAIYDPIMGIKEIPEIKWLKQYDETKAVEMLWEVEKINKEWSEDKSAKKLLEIQFKHRMNEKMYRYVENFRMNILDVIYKEEKNNLSIGEITDRLLSMNVDSEDILFSAARRGNVELIKYLGEKKLLTLNGDRLVTALNIALFYGNDEFALYLLENNEIPLFTEDPLKKLPISYSSNETIVKFISSKMASKSLHFSVKIGDMDAIKEFISRKEIDFFEEDKLGKTIFDYAIDFSSETNGFEIFKLLVNTCGIEKINKSSESTLLHKVLTSKLQEPGAFLIKEGIDLSIMDSSRRSALFIAVKKGLYDIVEAIIERFPEIANIPNKRSVRPIHLAADLGHVSIFKLLLDKSKELEINVVIPESGYTILHIASSNNNVSIINFLIERDYKKNGEVFNFNAQDNEGKTALHLAVLEGNVEAVKALVDSGKLDLSIHDFQNQTALDYANQFDQKDEKYKNIQGILKSAIDKEKIEGLQKYQLKM